MFDFNAADFAVLEASSAPKPGKAVGRARLDGNAAVTHQLVIKLADARAERPPTIAGKVVDPRVVALVSEVVLITAAPDACRVVCHKSSAVPDLGGTDRDHGRARHLVRDHRSRRRLRARAAPPIATSTAVSGEVEDQAPVTRTVNGGATDVTLTIEPGVLVSGTVATATEDPVPSFTLTVFRRDGASRELEIARSIVEPGGRFDVHLRPGDVELIATARSGLAPSEPVHVTAKVAVTDVKLVVSAGGTLRGAVIDASSAAPIPFARVMREARGGGASAQPANAGTVTRADGTFELTGIPAGPVSITIGADSYHPKIEGGMTVRDGETLGPISLRLTPLADGEQPTLELVGIGVKLTPDGDALRVDLVIPNSGAAAAAWWSAITWSPSTAWRPRRARRQRCRREDPRGRRHHRRDHAQARRRRSRRSRSSSASSRLSRHALPLALTVALPALHLWLLPLLPLLELFLPSLLRQLAELRLHDHLVRVLMDDLEIDRRPRLGRRDRVAELGVGLHRHAADRHDHVAHGEPVGLRGRAIGLDRADQHELDLQAPSFCSLSSAGVTVAMLTPR